VARPLITEDVEALAECMQHAAAFHACILGPVPFGQQERIQLQINAIIVESRDAAELACWAHVRNACAMYGYPYDEDEWEIVHLTAVNCN